jgi:hypothetical protein
MFIPDPGVKKAVLRDPNIFHPGFRIKKISDLGTGMAMA